MPLFQHSWITTTGKVPENVVDNAHSLFSHYGIIINWLSNANKLLMYILIFLHLMFVFSISHINKLYLQIVKQILLIFNTINFIFQLRILVSVNWKFCDASLWLMYEQQWPHVAIASGMHVSGSTKGTHLSPWQEYKNVKWFPLWFIIVIFLFVLKQC